MSNEQVRGDAGFRARFGSETPEVWDVLKMIVARVEDEIVLEALRGDPDVMVGDRRALAAQMSVHLRVVSGRFGIGKENADGGLGEEGVERGFVLARTRAEDESAMELGR